VDAFFFIFTGALCVMRLSRRGTLRREVCCSAEMITGIDTEKAASSALRYIPSDSGCSSTRAKLHFLRKDFSPKRANVITYFYHHHHHHPTAETKAVLIDYPQGKRAITHHAGPARIDGS
jgi:hypothetical protein